MTTPQNNTQLAALRARAANPVAAYQAAQAFALANEGNEQMQPYVDAATAFLQALETHPDVELLVAKQKAQIVVNELAKAGNLSALKKIGGSK